MPTTGAVTTTPTGCPLVFCFRYPALFNDAPLLTVVTADGNIIQFALVCEEDQVGASNAIFRFMCSVASFLYCDAITLVV